MSSNYIAGGLSLIGKKIIYEDINMDLVNIKIKKLIKLIESKSE